MSYSTFVVANAVIFRAREKGIFVNHLKIQKLVFFTHAWLLALHGVPAVRERPEAWAYGPVFDALFHRLKNRRRDAIRDCIRFADVTTNAFQALMPSRKDERFWDVLEQVLDRYGRLTERRLSTLAHVPGGPWDQARRNRQAFILDDVVREHFKGMLK